MANDYITFEDALTHLVDYERANPSAERTRFHRRAVFSAMRDLSRAHSWSYYWDVKRVNTVAPYSTGTIEFDYTGGLYERLVTLTDGTWPSWAAYGVLIIDGIQYQVAERINGQYLQLSIHSNPQDNVDAGTSYILMRDRYLLPHDFWTADQVHPENSWPFLKYVHPRDWVGGHRFGLQSGTPREYTILGSLDFQGCMDIAFYPYPDQAKTYDFSYSRGLGKIAVQDEHDGTITVSSGSTTITGDSTDFNDEWVGALIRTGEVGPELPTGPDGANPFVSQRTIMSVESATSLTVDFPPNETASGIRYVISSPIDLEVGVMGTVFYRCCENQLAKMTRLGGAEGVSIVDGLYKQALLLAKEQDSRNTSPRRIGGQIYGRRLAYYPLGEDIE